MVFLFFTFVEIVFLLAGGVAGLLGLACVHGRGCWCGGGGKAVEMER